MLSTPRILFLETTTECNLRCAQCHMWKTTEPKGSLTTEEKIRIIEGFGGWAKGATVVITGGETMKKKEEFFALARACREAGLDSVANTNATYMDDGATIDRVLTEGPSSFVISIDSQRPELHDWFRGQKGTGAQVRAAIQALIARKRSAFPDSKVGIFTNTVLFDRNISEVRPLVEDLVALGVEGIMFQVLGRTFFFQGDRDVFFEKHFPKDIAAFDRAADELLALKLAGAPIFTSLNDIRLMKLYVRTPDSIDEQVCDSGERNIIVDQMGDVEICFYMRNLLGGNVLGNVRRHSLRALWEGDMAERARGIMSSCRLACGMLSCHRKMS